MTIPSTVRKAGPLLGNGTTTAFPFTFKVFAATDLQVVVADSQGLSSVLALGADYSVALNANQDTSPGGTVTHPLSGTPLPGGSVLTILGDISYDQPLDLPSGGSFSPLALENQLDRATMQIQQLAEGVARSLRVAPSSSADATLPQPQPNTVVGWNETGDALVNYAAADLATVVITGTSYTNIFNGNGSQTAFALTANPGSVNALDVAIGGVSQVNGVDFTVSGTTLTFTSAPPAGTANIAVRYVAAVPIGSANAQDVTYLPAGAGAVSTTVQAKLREVAVSAADFNVPATGLVSATAAIQAMFTACASAGNVREIVFDGVYLLTNSNNDAQATCAVIISGLKRCRIRGTAGTKFIVSTGGIGASQFGMFRIQNGCEDLEFCDFEMDGSGITITGTGANRSFSFVLANFDQNNQATDLPANKRITFRNLYIHDIGGGPSVLPRSASLAAAPMTDGMRVIDCEMLNLLNVNHGVGACFVRNLVVENCKIWNNIPSVSPIDNMAVDASRGCINASIRNNWVRGFCYGMKCETQTNAGPSGTEIRPSSRVVIENNRLEEIGDPTSLIVGGDNTFGIKANGTDVVIRGNTVRKRTVGLTTGGLYAGLIAVNTHNDESEVVVEGNNVFGASYGMLHNDTTATTRECSVVIKNNRFVDCTTYGASLQANVEFDDNVVLRAGASAVEIQVANMTFVRRNRFFDCASTDNIVIPDRVAGVYQSTVGAIGGYTEITDNVIVDTRGASAGEYGYFLRGATTFTNPLVFRPGYTTGLLTAAAYDSNFNIVGDTLMIGGINRPGPRRFLSTNNPQTTAPWSTQAWNTGDEATLHPPVVGSPRGWRCTVAGTPGTWVSLGNL